MTGIRDLFIALGSAGVEEFTSDQIETCHDKCTTALIARAKKDGLLISRKIKGSRRHVYTITNRGRKYMHWLNSGPISRDTEDFLRDIQEKRRKLKEKRDVFRFLPKFG